MPPPSAIGLGVLLGGMLLAVSCSGPSPNAPDASEATEDPSRVYHVRLDVVEDKAVADRILGRALTWWEERSDAIASRPLTLSEESPVSVVWQAPLYRVQVGPFASRAEADSVLQVARSAFPDAFVSPERLESGKPK